MPQDCSFCCNTGEARCPVHGLQYPRTDAQLAARAMEAVSSELNLLRVEQRARDKDLRAMLQQLVAVLVTPIKDPKRVAGDDVVERAE